MIKKNTYLSIEDSYRLVIRASDGASTRDLMREFNISSATVYRKLLEYRANKKFTRVKKKRPTKVRQEVIEQVQYYEDEIDKYASREEIIVKYNLLICKATMSNYLHKDRLFARIALNKFMLEAHQEEERAEIAASMKQLTYEEWTQYVFLELADWSVRMALGVPKRQMNSSINLATVSPWMFLVSLTSINLEKQSIPTTTCLLFFTDVGIRSNKCQVSCCMGCRPPSLWRDNAWKGVPSYRNDTTWVLVVASCCRCSESAASAPLVQSYRLFWA